MCRHQYVAADTLAQTWGAATKFVLSVRLREADANPALDDLLTQWREHLSAPFWHRMGYRPLWSTWEARPASAIR